MTVLKFLDEATTNKNLQTFREETNPRGKDVEEIEAEDNLASEQLQEYEDLSEIEEETIEDKAGDYPKKLQRRQSNSLKRLLIKYDPKLKCGESDLSCLNIFVQEHVKELDFGNDTKKLKSKLMQLQTVVAHLHPSTSTQRNHFVKLTAIGKAY